MCSLVPQSWLARIFRSVLSWIIHGGGVLLLLLLFVMVAHALVWMVKTKRGHFFYLTRWRGPCPERNIVHEKMGEDLICSSIPTLTDDLRQLRCQKTKDYFIRFYTSPPMKKNINYSERRFRQRHVSIPAGTRENSDQASILK